MFKKNYSSLLLFLSFALSGSPALAATVFDPATRWSTIDSPHFRINYPQGQELVAQKAANFAEEARAKLIPFMKKAPSMTDITLVDNSDDVNGFAIPLPNSTIYLYLNTPGEQDLWGKYDSFLRTVITHEYTHIVNMEDTGGIPELFNRAFGRSFYPNFFFNPTFMLEGLAVTTESKFSATGRSDESYYDAVLRTAILENTPLTIDQVGGYYLSDWPGGNGAYIYGSALNRYLLETYGEDTLAKISATNGSEPLGINYVVKKVVGKDLYQVWDEFIFSLKKRYARELTRISAIPLTQSKAITETGRYHRYPNWLPDGRLIYNEADGRKSAKLKAYQDGKTEALFSKPALAPNSLSSDGNNLYYSRGEELDHFTTASDLFRYDLKRKKQDRLTEGKHIQDPSVSPDGSKILAVQNLKGRYNLVLLDKDGKQIKVLTKNTDFTQFSFPHWSPDGKKAVLSAWKDGSRDLYLFSPDDSSSSSLTPLWRDKALDINPTFTEDGKNLLFSSDRDGIFNLYSYQMEDGKLFRITNVLGAAIEPAVSPDGKTIAFASLSSKGFDIRTMPFDQASWTPESSSKPALAEAIHEAQPEKEIYYPPHSYNPLPTLWPKAWSPTIASDEQGMVLGGAVLGQDALFQHNFSLMAGIGLASRRPFYALNYFNDQLYPTLQFALSDTPAMYGLSNSAGDSVDFWQRQQSGRAGLSFPGVPGLAMGTNWVNGESYSFGFNWSQVDDLTLIQGGRGPILGMPNAGRTNSLYAQYQAADNYSYVYSTAPEGGSVTTLGYEKADPAWGSQHSFDRVWADYRHYHPLPVQGQTFAWRVSGGSNFSKIDGQYYLGGNDSMSITSLLDLRYGVTTYGQQRVPLRGYGLMRGNSLAAFSGEYRFPLLEIQHGPGTVPVFFDRLGGAAFYDVGQMWDASEFWRSSSLGLKHGVGAEARLVSHILQIPTELRFGLAQGINPEGQTQVYFQLGSMF